MRKPTKGGSLFAGTSFGKTAKPKKIEPAPAPRRMDLEQSLCSAIAHLKLVTLTYKHDGVSRTFQPSAVYFTSKGKVCVSGVQITNPSKPQDNLEPHNFEVGLVSALSITNRDWIVDFPLDRLDEKYANGIICPR